LVAPDEVPAPVGHALAFLRGPESENSNLPPPDRRLLRCLSRGRPARRRSRRAASRSRHARARSACRAVRTSMNGYLVLATDAIRTTDLRSLTHPHKERPPLSICTHDDLDDVTAVTRLVTPSGRATGKGGRPPLGGSGGAHP